MEWEERERERYDSLVRYIFQSFAVSKNVKQALLTSLHVLTVRYARQYRVGLGPERGRWLDYINSSGPKIWRLCRKSRFA